MKSFLVAAGAGGLLGSLVPAVLAAGACAVKPTGCPEYEVLNKSFPAGNVTISTRGMTAAQQIWVANAITALD